MCRLAVRCGRAPATTAKLSTRPCTASARHASRVGAHASTRRSAVCGTVRCPWPVMPVTFLRAASSAAGQAGNGGQWYRRARRARTRIPSSPSGSPPDDGTATARWNLSIKDLRGDFPSSALPGSGIGGRFWASQPSAHARCRSTTSGGTSLPAPPLVPQATFRITGVRTISQRTKVPGTGAVGPARSSSTARPSSAIATRCSSLPDAAGLDRFLE